MESDTLSGSRTPPVAVAAAVLTIALVLATGLFVGARGGQGDSKAVHPDSVDVGFSRDMRDHHAQAVEMSVMVRDATTNREIRTLALDILLTQQQQIGQMYGWLDTWGLRQAGSYPPLAWMTRDGTQGERLGGAGMDHGAVGIGDNITGPTPGMATNEELRRLVQARGTRAERLYLQLMIPHHQAGVAMSKYAALHAEQQPVRRLARSIIDSQTAEVAVLRSLLKVRGGPVPDH